jgi:hypothetical protein
MELCSFPQKASQGYKQLLYDVFNEYQNISIQIIKMWYPLIDYYYAHVVLPRRLNCYYYYYNYYL